MYSMTGEMKKKASFIDVLTGVNAFWNNQMVISIYVP